MSDSSLMDFFWNKENGPIENILHLAEMGALAMGGFVTKAAITVSALLGISPTLLGRKLDEYFGLESLDDLINLSDDEKQADASVPLSSRMIVEGARYRRYNAPDDKRSILDMILQGKSSTDGLLPTLKNIAKKILTGGLLSILTVSAIESANKKNSKDDGERSKSEPEKPGMNAKKSLEQAILEALKA